MEEKNEHQNNNINNKHIDFIGKIILKKFKILKKIRRGSQAQIYLGENINTLEQFAIKVEKNKPENCLLKNEIYILQNLQNNYPKNNGIVDLITCAKYRDYLILVEKLLGRSLDILYLDLSKKFNLLDICQISLQCLDRIEYVHSKGYIHCDIKPENFVIGLEDPNMIYLIDFGLGQKYLSLKTGKHIEFKFTGYMSGTARYASRNALRGKRLSRRDDIESFIYMVLYFLAKKLPWQGLKAKNVGEKYKKIYEYKKDFNYRSFCRNYPKEIILLFDYVYSLAFTEKPSYKYIRELFQKILEINNLYVKDFFSWMDKKTYNEYLSKSRRALSESKNKKNENKIMIRSSIAGNLKESTKANYNIRISKINKGSNIILDENNDDNNNINNIEKEENINININNEKNNDNNLLSTETNIKQKLEKYPDDEEEKKCELKKELEIIKEEENEDDNDFNIDNKKLGGSEHLYKINMNEYQFNFNNNNIKNNLVKSNIEDNAKKDIKNKLIGKSNSNSQNKENESDKNIKNEINFGNNNINIINEDFKNKEDEEKNENENNININNEKNKNINEIKQIDNNKNENEENNKIVLREIKSNNSIINFKYDLEQRIKSGKSNIIPKKIVFKKKFKNDGDIKYSSVGSQDYYDAHKKKGFFSATQRDTKTKINKKLDEENNKSNKHKGKNQNCLII